MALPTLQDLLKTSAGWLQGKGIANARRESEWIFAQVLGLTRIELYTQYDRPLAPAEVDRLRALVARRGKREPLAYVLGNQDFRGLRISVGPGVLVPRPETEELVDLVLRDVPHGGVIADIGTGSGAIACALRRERPDLAVIAVEFSPAALPIAHANLGRGLVRGDLATALSAGFDAIVANLPYIADSERSLCDPETVYEPAEALFAADDGVALMAALIADAPRLLRPGGGVLWLEHGFAQAPRLAARAIAAGLTPSTHRDLTGKDRFTRAAKP